MQLIGSIADNITSGPDSSRCSLNPEDLIKQEITVEYHAETVYQCGISY
jgi:hypothetical protein